MVRAGAISTLVFWSFALLGEVIFRDVLQAQFASFQIFGHHLSCHRCPIRF
jgi:hypothetical protein